MGYRGSSSEERTGSATGIWESLVQRCELRLREQEDRPPAQEGKDTEGGEEAEDRTLRNGGLQESAGEGKG